MVDSAILLEQVEQFADVGADLITVHAETKPAALDRALDRIAERRLRRCRRGRRSDALRAGGAAPEARAGSRRMPPADVRTSRVRPFGQVGANPGQ